MTARVGCIGVLLFAAVLAGCGDADSDSPAASDAPTTTIDAPLRPELRQAGSGGVGRIEEWVATWNLVNEGLITQLGDESEFPRIELVVDDFTVRGGEDGFPVFTGQIGEVILGGVLTVEDGGVTSLLLVGQPTDSNFLAAYAIWLGSLDPTIEPGTLLAPEVAFGDEQRTGVESNGRTYEAVKVDGSDGSVIAVSMVAGPSFNEQATASAHGLIRRNVLGALVAETAD